ncbi:MAG TPA: DUF721 domain-containing protein [Kofleriaceae bacterium]|nr:DUF721 domain-containing protein [Kofleriaceae bacterium]
MTVRWSRHYHGGGSAGAYGRFRDAASASDLIGGLLDRHGVQREVGAERIAAEWARLVGPRIAARSWPGGVRDGVLVVRVANSAWLHELAFLEADLVARLRADLGPSFAADKIRFVLGGPGGDIDEVRRAARAVARTRAARPVRRAPPLTPGDAERIDRETAAVDDDELRAIIRDARRRINA